MATSDFMQRIEKAMAIRQSVAAAQRDRPLAFPANPPNWRRKGRAQ